MCVCECFESTKRRRREVATINTAEFNWIYCIFQWIPSCRQVLLFVSYTYIVCIQQFETTRNGGSNARFLLVTCIATPTTNEDISSNVEYHIALAMSIGRLVAAYPTILPGKISISSKKDYYYHRSMIDFLICVYIRNFPLVRCRPLSFDEFPVLLDVLSSIEIDFFEVDSSPSNNDELNLKMKLIVNKSIFKHTWFFDQWCCTILFRWCCLSL